MIQLYHQIIHYNLGGTYYEMSISEKIKAIDYKIDYNLDRQTGNISALSSENVSKYEFLTGRDVLPEKRFARKSCWNQKI